MKISFKTLKNPFNLKLKTLASIFFSKPPPPSPFPLKFGSQHPTMKSPSSILVLGDFAWILGSLGCKKEYSEDWSKRTRKSSPNRHLPAYFRPALLHNHKTFILWWSWRLKLVSSFRKEKGSLEHSKLQILHFFFWRFKLLVRFFFCFYNLNLKYVHMIVAHPKPNL